MTSFVYLNSAAIRDCSAAWLCIHWEAPLQVPAASMLDLYVALYLYLTPCIGYSRIPEGGDVAHAGMRTFESFDISDLFASLEAYWRFVKFARYPVF